MGIYDGILLISDMDGTLTDSKGAISRENAEAIRYFQENGGLFTVGSGRPPEHFESFKDHFVCNTYMVALDGSMIFDAVRKEAVSRYPIKGNVKKDIKIIASDFQRSGTIGIRTEHDFYYKKEDQDIDTFLAEIDSDVYVAMFMQDREQTSSMSESVPPRFPHYKFSRSWSEGLEMFSSEAGKGTSLMKIKELTGARLVVAAGNYDNDIEMLQMADIGVCVSNATDAVKNAADVITVSCDENAIALIIDELKRDNPFNLHCGI